jgi:hypothetical protein
MQRQRQTHLIVDGVDGRTHYVETVDASKLDDIRRGQHKPFSLDAFAP